MSGNFLQNLFIIFAIAGFVTFVIFAYLNGVREEKKRQGQSKFKQDDNQK